MQLPKHISLRAKFVIFIGAIISASYVFMLYRTAAFDEEMIIRQAEQQARMLYKQILLTRQWASDHKGLFVLERPGVKANPFLDLPTVEDASGNVFVMRNPAMITRELSRYADEDGLGHFKVTSLRPINPDNTADEVEKQSMLAFEKGQHEYVQVSHTDSGRILRFMAPLEVSNSCLQCHATHGYSLGDIRGALSISIPISWADELIKRNFNSLALIGIVSISIVTVCLFLMFEFLVVKRIAKLSVAMDRFPQRLTESSSLPSVFQDEIDIVTHHFDDFCDRLQNSQKELLKTKTQAFFNEKMASLGILTAGIAHEVNNPLGGMLNCIKNMQDNPDDTELQKRYLPLITKGLHQIESTMRQLLNFGRTEPLTERKVDLSLLFNECVDLLQFKLKDINLDLRVTVSKHYLLDTEALKQIIINIGLNAIQAMDGSGLLQISCSEENDILYLSFTDSGTGIAKDNLPHIFDPFFTTKDVGEGTGLGLAVTYSLVKKMEGEIEVNTEVRTGTTFTVKIPVSLR